MNKRRMNGKILEVCGGDGGLLFSLGEELRDGALHMALRGQLKNEAAHEFEDELMAALSVCRQIVLHLEGVSYMAGMALRSLLYVQQMVDEMEDASLVVADASPQVLEAFREMGFLEIIRVETE